MKVVNNLILIEDKAQKEGLHKTKNNYWKRNGIEVYRYPLPVGDYIIANSKVNDVINRKIKRGIAIKKMDFLGTYSVCVDTKFSIQEIISDVCGKQHERFIDECKLALNNNIKLYILIEDDGGFCDKRETIYNEPVSSIEGLYSWKNPRLFIFKYGVQKYPNATKGGTLARCLTTIQNKYGCEFVFCRSKDSGEIVLKLLAEDKYA